MESINIKKHIEHFRATIQKIQNQGDMYYRTKNIEINDREKSFYSITQAKNIRDCTKANNILASNFTRLLVDQKVQYSINNKMAIDGIDKTIDLNKFKKVIGKLGRNASNEIYGVLQWYIEDKEIKWKVLPSQQCILIYNDYDKDILEAVIRPYKENNIECAEIITKDGTEIYKMSGTDYKKVEDKPHARRNTNAGNVVLGTEPVAMNVLPISVLRNNDIDQTDLEMFKSYVDAYDFANSDFFNNLEDFQEMYWVLKGYQGQDAAEFMAEFKKSRILKVGEGGDASQIAQEVPYEARKVALEIAKKDIYRFGMGVDPDAIKGDTTNVTIMALFSNLDLKANQFEMQVEEFISDSVVIINEMASMLNKPVIGEWTVTFNRETIMNKESMMKTLQELGIVISNETLLKNAPIVDNHEAELLILEEVKKKQISDLGGSMDFEEEV